MWVPSQKVENNFGQFQSSEQHTAGTRECIPGPVFFIPWNRECANVIPGNKEMHGGTPVLPNGAMGNVHSAQ